MYEGTVPLSDEHVWCLVVDFYKEKHHEQLLRFIIGRLEINYGHLIELNCDAKIIMTVTATVEMRYMYATCNIVIHHSVYIIAATTGSSTEKACYLHAYTADSSFLSVPQVALFYHQQALPVVHEPVFL